MQQCNSRPGVLHCPYKRADCSILVFFVAPRLTGYTSGVTQRIVFLCSGTRGDIQPYLALGGRLQQAGAQAGIATHVAFRQAVESAGLAFLALPDNPNDLLVSPAYHGALTPGAGIWRSLRATVRFWRAAQPAFVRMWHDAWLACQQADCLVAGLPTWWAAHIAEALRIPCVFAPLQPLTPTRAFPAPLLPVTWSAGPAYNRLTYRLVEHMLWLPWRSILNRWRERDLGLRPAQRMRLLAGTDGELLPCVYGFSAHVVPRPPDWPATHQIAGYWFHDASPAWQPPAGLARFVEAGDPPAYIGFGSYPWPLAPVTARAVVEAVQMAGMRAVMLMDGRTAHSMRLPASIYAVSDAPHEWLFPRVTVAVHHGGAGTVAAALRAGTPMIVAPIAVDQFFWGRRIQALGVGRALRRHRISAHALAEALAQTAQDHHTRKQARLIQQALCSEDGVGRAIEVILKLPTS